MAAGVRAYTVPGRLSAEKRMAPAQLRTLGPPRYATRGKLPVARRDGERGKPRQLRHLCLRDGEWRLNALCSARSAKTVKFQSVRRLSRRLLGRLLRNLFLELADLGAEHLVAGLQQPVVEPADMLDRA